MRFISLVAIIFVLISCNQDQPAKDVSNSNNETNTLEPAVTPNSDVGSESAPQISTPQPTDNAPPPQQNQQVNVAAGDDGKVFHYVCGDGCASGKSDQAGNCPECGKALAHNTAFHNQQGNTATPPPITPPENQATNTQTPPPPAEPAQNAAGVWHYTCPNGHAGGAGTASACSECGATLGHNSAYHQ